MLIKVFSMCLNSFKLIAQQMLQNEKHANQPRHSFPVRWCLLKVSLSMQTNGKICRELDESGFHATSSRLETDICHVWLIFRCNWILDC